MTNTITYPYKPKPWFMLLAFIFFGACTAILANKALTNDRGLILNHIITMSPQSATIFYAVLALASAVLALFGAVGLWQGLTSKRKVTLGPDALICPKGGLSRQSIAVPYAQIADLQEVTVQKNTFLHIHHAGKKTALDAGNFPSKHQYEDFRHNLAARVTVTQRP